MFTCKLGGNTVCGLTMEERLAERNIAFMPVAFEVGGAETGAWSKLLKQLSEIAHSRRGHDKTYFRQRWSMEVAMCLARRGAQGALRRANTFRSANSEALDDGVLGGVGSEQPLVASAGGG